MNDAGAHSNRPKGHPASPPARLWVRSRPWVIPLILLLSVTLPHLAGGDWQRGDSGWYTAIGVQAFRTGEFWTLMGEPGQQWIESVGIAQAPADREILRLCTAH